MNFDTRRKPTLPAPGLLLRKVRRLRDLAIVERAVRVRVETGDDTAGAELASSRRPAPATPRRRHVLAVRTVRARSAHSCRSCRSLPFFPGPRRSARSCPCRCTTWCARSPSRRGCRWSPGRVDARGDLGAAALWIPTRRLVYAEHRCGAIDTVFAVISRTRHRAHAAQEHPSQSSQHGEAALLRACDESQTVLPCDFSHDFVGSS